MTGTGTQNDPFIITTAEELYSMETEGGEEIWFRLGNDIDFEQTQYSEDFRPIVLNCAGFDGNGKKLRNIVYSYPSGTASVFRIPSRASMSISGLTVENLIITGKTVAIFFGVTTLCELSLNGCTFTGYVSYGSESAQYIVRKGLFHNDMVKISMELCTVALRIDFIKAIAMIGRGSVRHCQFRLDISTLTFSSPSDDADGLFSETTVTDSYLFGNIRQRVPTETENSYFFSNSTSYFSNFYMVVTFGAGITNVYWRGTFSTPCFYDSEAAFADHTVTFYIDGSSSSPSRRNFLALTTAQAKDAAYLRSVGFSCEEESE